MIKNIAIILSICIIIYTIYNKFKYPYHKKKKTLKIAILIITNNKKKDIDKDTLTRWELEKSNWKRYMNLYKNIDTFFIQCNEIEAFNNVINCKCKESYRPGIFQKTIITLNLLVNKYDFYIRTNLSTFVDFATLTKKLNTLPKNIPIFTGGGCNKANWVSGTSIILNNNTCQLISKNGFLDKYFKSNSPDDVLLGKLLKDNFIYCHQDHSNYLYEWNYTISFEENIKLMKENHIFIRLKTNNIQLYSNNIDKLIKKYY